jgi:hypothetical protein
MTRRLAMGGKQLAAATALNPFTQLPPELSFHIISFLSYKDALRLAQVPPHPASPIPPNSPNSQLFTVLCRTSFEEFEIWYWRVARR